MHSDLHSLKKTYSKNKVIIESCQWEKKKKEKGLILINFHLTNFEYLVCLVSLPKNKFVNF